MSLTQPFTPGFSEAPALTGQEVIAKMHKEYAGKFDPYFTFDQTAIFYNAAGEVTKKEVWHEAIAFPGKLVIKFNEFEAGNGVLFKEDSQFVFKNNALQNQMRRVHDVLVLGFDVYHQPADRTVAQMQEAGFDLSKVFKTTWQGKKVYVVGVTSLDQKASHFIIDEQKLWLLKTVRQTGENQTAVELKGYQKLKGNWIATDLTFSANGKTTLHELYYNMKFPKSLPTEMFTVEGFKNARW
ncbi:hypothetical protein [Nibribacter koreensis]